VEGQPPCLIKKAMTLITSYITKHGIIQASDSNLTTDKGNAGFGQKVFPIPYLNASLAYSGCYTIDGKKIDIWMNDFISRSFHTISSIKEFTSTLSNRMKSNMRDDEISEVSIIHIVGYDKFENRSHVEHWNISNTNLNPQDGSYSKAENEFHYYNDFNSRTNLEHRNLIKQFDLNPLSHQSYINGFPPGRISSKIFKHRIDESLKFIREKSDWEFRPPENLFEFSNLVKLYFDFTIRLFQMSNYNAMYIGGEIQTHLIPAPQDLLKD
jgi:hypothetical protein